MINIYNGSYEPISDPKSTPLDTIDIVFLVIMVLYVSYFLYIYIKQSNKPPGTELNLKPLGIITIVLFILIGLAYF